MNEYEPLPAQGTQRTAAGSHDASRRSSLSETSGEFNYSGSFGVSPPPSPRRRSQDTQSENGSEHGDYLPVPRASSDCNQPPNTFHRSRRSLEATEGTQSADTLVGNEGSKTLQSADEPVAIWSDAAKPETNEGLTVEELKPWAPFYLQKMALAGFVLVYVALLAAMVVLGVFDEKNQGLATSNSSRHYLWQYGPTAGLYAPNLPTIYFAD